MKNAFAALCLFACVSLLGEPAFAEPDALSDLLTRLSAVQALSAHFREEKRMALLKAPLVSEGTLYYQRPRMLARHIDKPEKSSVVLNGDKLSFGDAQHSESMGLDAQPAVRVLVDTFVSVLAGDRAALERMAELKYEAREGQGFRIVITPKDPRVLNIVKSMAFEGEGVTLRTMELLDANGDRSVTTFSELKVRAPFPSKDVAQLFRVGG